MSSENKLIRLIQSYLSKDLLHARYRHLADIHPFAGHCYIATEAIYHMLGAKNSGWKPYILTHNTWKVLNPGETHWFLKHKSGKIIDITGDQFINTIPYHDGKGCGFLTKRPSKRTQMLLTRIKNG